MNFCSLLYLGLIQLTHQDLKYYETWKVSACMIGMSNFMYLSVVIYTHLVSPHHISYGKQGRSKLDNWGGADIHIFVFCTINFFWNRLFLWCVNTYIWISAPPPPPPIIELATALANKAAKITYNNSVYLTFYLHIPCRRRPGLLWISPASCKRLSWKLLTLFV